MKLPKKITPCPIVDSVVELRFEPTVPVDAVFGLVFSGVRALFPDFTKLPILQVPDILREKDPNFRWSPHFQANAGQFVMKVGPRVIALGIVKEYVGWDAFSRKLEEVLAVMRESGLAREYLRLGIRYVNFFKSDIYQNLNLKISLEERPFRAAQTTFGATVEDGQFQTHLQIMNGCEVNSSGTRRQGSVVDIDTYVERKISEGELAALVRDCHETEKGAFFSLLKSEFISTMNPEY